MTLSHSMKNWRNIVLIGMPGAGKSTIGVLLAKKLARKFVDTDILIQTRSGAKLQDILDRDGYKELRHLEEKAILSTDFKNYVIATGGSAVYSDIAMKHLAVDGIIIYLEVNIPELKNRISDFGSRGIACQPGLGLEDLYNERVPLYERYAELTIHCQNRNQDLIVDDIVAQISK